MRISVSFYLLFILFFASCSSDKNTSTSVTIDKNIKFYDLKSPQSTGLDFINKIDENTSYNTFLHDAMLQGAGVGILDIDNDGYKDIYFCGNQVGDKLYRNTGKGLVFEDVTAASKIKDEGTWSTGVAIVDINSDGYDDIYVSKFFYDETQKLTNKLYVNNKDGSFTERAEEYGIADQGYSIMSNFFDFDNDGDLDLYVANQPPNSMMKKKELGSTRNLKYSDHFYRNDNGKYTDQTNTQNIANYNYSLSATAGDLNNDGWTDLYVACDYEEPDMLFINNKGQLKNEVDNAFRHMGNFSMGSDMADINNDGYMDIYTVDMVAEDNYRQKTNMSGMNPEKFWKLAKNGYHYQYMFNSLQLNNGNGTFSEIAQMANVSNTDWSWAPLFIDVNRDGDKDLIVSNGLFKDLRNKDFEKKRKKFLEKKKGRVTVEEVLQIAIETPSVKIKNFAFENTGELGFIKRTEDWGLNEAGWSQGMAYADFDNDGDLDLVMSNTNQVASFYENKASEHQTYNYLNIRVSGPKNNTRGFNSRIELTSSDGKKQITDHTPYRGYMSTCDDLSQFGLGTAGGKVSVRVRFPDGKVWTKSVKPNQTVLVDYKEAIGDKAARSVDKKMFEKSILLAEEINYPENIYDDYDKEILIPYKMSNLGPCMASADLNKDGRTDFYIGGASGIAGRLFLSSPSGYVESKQAVFENTKNFEDGGAHFVDLDGNGVLDLYVASGGNEFPEGSEGYQDRLYLYQADGTFKDLTSALGKIRISSSAVCFPDFNGDGKKDIFIGGRQVPGKYGRSSSSILLEQGQQGFTDVTETKGKIFNELGMVTDAQWKNVMGDETPELVVMGEWMPIKIYSFNGTEMIDQTPVSLAKESGMWNTMEIADIDADGNMDIIAGNLGLNNKYKATETEPFKLFVNDFDSNGTNDVYLGFYEEGKCYPVRGRQCSSQQMPFVAEKFENYDMFAQSTVEQVIEGKTEGMSVKEVNTFAHKIYYGDGAGNFEAQKLSAWSQAAPTYSVVVHDFNGDGKKDIFTVGNFYEREVETTRSDAGTGYIMLNKGNRNFELVHPAESGIMAFNDARAATVLTGGTNPILAIANNSAPMEFYTLTN